MTDHHQESPQRRESKVLGETIGSSLVLYLRQSPLLNYLAVYFFIVMAYGLLVVFFDNCCYRLSLLSIIYGVKNFVTHLLFGIYAWMWNHSSDIMRFTVGQTIVLYGLMLTVVGLIYDALLSKGESFVTNFVSVILGALLAHVPVEFMLVAREADDAIVNALNAVLLNMFAVFPAMIFSLLQLHKLPFVNFQLNRLMLVAGFITALIFLFIYGSVGTAIFFYIFPFIEPTKVSFYFVQLIILTLALWLSLLIIRFLRLKQHLTQLQDRDVSHEVLEVTQANIKRRLLEK